MKANSLEELVTNSNIAGDLRNNTDWHDRLVRFAQMVADWQKEKMMKVAVEGTIVEDMLVSEKLHRVESEYLDRYVGQGGNLKDGQKVKLYVFKED